MTKIKVEYPTEEAFVSHVAKMLAKIHRTQPVVKMIPVNQEEVIHVKINISAQDMTNEQLCMASTGLSPEAYQAKFKKAWNE